MTVIRGKQSESGMMNSRNANEALDNGADDERAAVWKCTVPCTASIENTNITKCVRITEFLCVIFISSSDLGNKKRIFRKAKAENQRRTPVSFNASRWGGRSKQCLWVGTAPTDFTIQIERRYFGEIQRGSWLGSLLCPPSRKNDYTGLHRTTNNTLPRKRVLGYEDETKTTSKRRK